jgi:hypothetical protein
VGLLQHVRNARRGTSTKIHIAMVIEHISDISVTKTESNLYFINKSSRQNGRIFLIGIYCVKRVT